MNGPRAAWPAAVVVLSGGTAMGDGPGGNRRWSGAERGAVIEPSERAPDGAVAVPEEGARFGTACPDGVDAATTGPAPGRPRGHHPQPHHP